MVHPTDEMVRTDLGRRVQAHLGDHPLRLGHRGVLVVIDALGLVGHVDGHHHRPGRVAVVRTLSQALDDV